MKFRSENTSLPKLKQGLLRAFKRQTYIINNGEGLLSLLLLRATYLKNFFFFQSILKH